MMHTFIQPVRRGRRGAAVVEFAVVVPLLLLFVFGIIELGRGLMVSHLLTDAARKACRIGALPGKSSIEIESAVSDVVKPSGFQGVTTSVLVNGQPTEAASANPGDEITVQISVPVKNVTWLPGGDYLQGNLTSSYSLRRE